MIVWILKRDSYDEGIEGVYTAEAKQRKEQEMLAEAKQRRDAVINGIDKQIEELIAIRNPIIYEAEALLPDEAAAKEANHAGILKEVRKKRKALLRQAEHLTYSIHREERTRDALACLTTKELLSHYGRYCSFEEHVVEEV